VYKKAAKHKEILQFRRISAVKSTGKKAVEASPGDLALETMNRSAMSANLVTCSRASKTTQLVISFESTAHENNRISNVVFLVLLMFPTIFLNAVAIITIQKTRSLKTKLCYYVILVQSSVDLGVGCFGTPIMIIYLLSPFLKVDLCVLFFFAKSTIFLSSGLSVVTLCALTMERYLCTFHPVAHRTRLTKKGFATYTIGSALILMAIVVASTFSENDVTRIAATGILSIFSIFNLFAYVRIYFKIRSMTRESRARVSPNDVAWQENRKRHVGKTKQALSCFIIVMSFTVLLLPYVLSPIFVQFENMVWNAYFWWSISLVILNSSSNSVIFFWRNALLRKEAIKLVKKVIMQ
jgi:hypothetical protein